MSASRLQSHFIRQGIGRTMLGELVPMFEELHCPFMLLGRLAGRKRAEIAAFSRLRIQLARIKAIAAGAKLANHGMALCDRGPWSRRRRTLANLAPGGGQVSWWVSDE